MAAICTTNFGNPGVKCDKGDIRGVPVGLLLTTDSFSFSTYSSFDTEADYLTAIKAKNMFPVLDILEFDDNSEETPVYTSPLGIKKKLRDGKYDLTFRMDASLQKNQELQKFSGAKIRAFIIDSNGYVWGYSDDATTVQGFSIAYLNTENQVTPTADAPGWTSLTITFANPNEWNDYGLLLMPSFVVEDLSSLSNVVMGTSGTPSGTEIIVTVGAETAVIEDGVAKTIPISGIPEADFSFVKASDGTAQTANSMTDNGDGTYTFDFTGLVTGSVTLVAPASQTNTFLIESTGAVSFTI